jgi:hypothetical protein
MPLTTVQPCTTLCLTAVKLTVSSDVEADVSTPGSILLGTSAPHSSLILEDCVFETKYDSTVMSRLVACAAQSGGQVGGQTAVVTRTCTAWVQLWPALPAICCIARH